MSRTVGIDLSAEPVRTAICAVTSTPGAAIVELPIRPADDATVLAACSADRVGIDCPFGWPEPFLAAIAAHAAGLPWPGRDQSAGDYRRELRYRATDYYVHPPSLGNSGLVAALTDLVSTLRSRDVEVRLDLPPADGGRRGRLLLKDSHPRDLLAGAAPTRPKG